MKKRKTTTIPGVAGCHSVISPAMLEERGAINVTNTALEAARTELWQLFTAWQDKPINVHVVVSVDPVPPALTDSAGAPLMTRSGG